MSRLRLRRNPKGGMKKPIGWQKKLQKGYIEKKRKELLKKQLRNPRKQLKRYKKQLEKQLKKRKESSMRSYNRRRQRG